MIQNIKIWLHNRQIQKALREVERAIYIVNSVGYSAVKLRKIAGTTYIENPDGSYSRVGKPEKVMNERKTH
jgi:hypothetical protein